jgi:hypothetical protein
MIFTAPEHLPTTINLPPAIIRSYQSTSDSIPLDSLLKYDNKLNSIIILDNKIKLNANNYNGFERTIYSFNSCKEDAISRYKQIYKTGDFNSEAAKPFLDAIKEIVYNSRFIPRFSFYPDGAKAVFNLCEQEITVEYDFDEPEFAFVSKFIDDVLHVKDTTIVNLGHAFGEFL